MKEYHKIQTMFKREKNKPCRIIEGAWTTPELEYLKDNQWEFTEKVDGTNIRVMWDGKEIKHGGKTDNAQLHCDLIRRLDEIFKPKIDTLREIFPTKDDELPQVCFYGEGYGAGIQRGGLYKPTKDFVLFDILIGVLYLQRKDVEDIASKLDIDVVPVIGHGTLQQGIDMVKRGLVSKWGNFPAEGIVARPVCELKDRRGKRIITKIKYRDFIQYRRT